MLRKIRALAVLTLLLLAAAIGPTSPTRAAIANGFSISAQLVPATIPVAIDFSPDEKLMFIAEQNGTIQIVDVSPAGVLTKRATKALDIQSKICSNFERGLLGIAVDPGYAANGFVYVYYSFNRSNSCVLITSGPATGQTPYNRVSRFTVGADGAIDPASELVLVDYILSTGGNHNAGAIHFGKDGYLYIAVGDGGCDYAGNSGCGGQNDAARDLHVLLGKILRIDPAGATASARIPASNPFRASGQICADAPTPTPGTHCQETFAYGFRNPFRFAMDPNTAGTTTALYVNDVGQSAWEEIDLAESGKDFRWNICEGTHAMSGACGAPGANERNPIHEYAHSGDPDTNGCVSITGGAVVPSGVWPAGYGGKYLFADYVCGKIFMIDPAAPATRTTFADSLVNIVDLRFGPGPDGLRSLYYVDRGSVGNGFISRITPTAGNRTPTAALSATPQFGAKAVTFDGTGSGDLDGDALTYLWNFGNGTTRSTTTATTSYTYPADGTYTATLQVRDAPGALSNVATILIDTINQPPVPTINLPTSGATFGVGDTITLAGSATDPVDGALPPSALRWEVLLHHRASLPGSHTHPFFVQTGNSLTFVTQSPEDLDAASNSYLEIRLTATDKDGATATVSRDLLPVKVSLTLRTSPAGLTVRANGTTFSDGATITSWRGYAITLEAPTQLSPNGRWHTLSSWDDSSASAARVIVTPSSPQTYTATFSRTGALLFMPLTRRP